MPTGLSHAAPRPGFHIDPRIGGLPDSRDRPYPTRENRACFIEWSVDLLVRFAAAAFGLGLAACEDNTTGTPLTPPPASTAVYVNVVNTAVNPAPTTGTAGRVVAPAAVFKVTYPDGTPAVGQVIAFSLNLGGHLHQTKDTVDAGGFASPGKWILGARAATQRLIASPVAGNAGFIDVVAEAGTPGAGPGTGAPGAHGPVPVNLGTAGNYVILAESAITNDTLPGLSEIFGDIGSGVAASSITGFVLTLDVGGAFATAPQVSGGDLCVKLCGSNAR